MALHTYFIDSIQILSVFASLSSVMLNVIMLNGFGEDLNLKSMDLIRLRVKIVPMIFVSTAFRCLSFTMIATLLRFYSIFPILWIFWISNSIEEMTVFGNSFFFNLCNAKTKNLYNTLANIFNGVAGTLVGAVLFPMEKHYWFKENFSQDEKRYHDLNRKRFFLFDAGLSFISHGVVLIIIVSLWETTDLLNQNLSICTFEIFKNNISTICWFIMILSFLNFLMTYLYFKS